MLNLGQNRRSFVPCDIVFLCGWHCETIGHLLYVASSLMHHFIAIGELKQKLHSGNAQFGSKLAIFLSRVTLKIDWWPWKTIGHLFYATSSFVHHLVTIVEFNLELQSRNAQFGSKSTIFWASWTWNLNDDLEKQKGFSPKRHLTLCIISSSYVNSNSSCSPEKDKLGYDICDLDLWPMTLTFCMDITFVIGNNSWKFRDDTMTGTYWKRCDRQTERQTDRQTDGQTDRKRCS